MNDSISTENTTSIQSGNLVIVYDAECPMCDWYTAEFQKRGLLSPNGREPYQKCGPYTRSVVDMNRARNHIALLDKATGKVKYGYDSLLEILSGRWAWVRKVGMLKVFRFCFMLLYDFISYNRKILAPSRTGFLNCIPDKNMAWRLAFMVLCILITEFTAGWYFNQFIHGNTRFEWLPFRESIMMIAQMLTLAAIGHFSGEKNLYDYLGHLAWISALGGLFLASLGLVLLIPGISSAYSGFLPQAALGAVVMFMFLEHKKRIKNNGFKSILSYSWIAIRIILFLVIFKTGI